MAASIQHVDVTFDPTRVDLPDALALLRVGRAAANIQHGRINQPFDPSPAKVAAYFEAAAATLRGNEVTPAVIDDRDCALYVAKVGGWCATWLADRERAAAQVRQ